MSIPAINQTGSHTVIKTPVVGVVVTGTPLDKFSLSLVEIIGEYLCDINLDDPKNIFKNLQLSVHSHHNRQRNRTCDYFCNIQSDFFGGSSPTDLTELAYDWRARSFLLTGQPNNDVIIDLFNRAFIHSENWGRKEPIGTEKITVLSAFDELENRATKGYTRTMQYAYQEKYQKVRLELTQLGIIKPKETITIDLDPYLKVRYQGIYLA
jgi:hypothetical protein